MDVHDIEGIHPLFATLLHREAEPQLSHDAQDCCQNAPTANSGNPLPEEARQESASGLHAPGYRTETEDSKQEPHSEPAAGARAQLTSSVGSDQVSGEQAHAGMPAGHNGPVKDTRSAELARLLSTDWPTACAALRDYLTAATAKDCSLMITLAPLQPAPRPQQERTRRAEPSLGAAMDVASTIGERIIGGMSERKSGRQLSAVQEDPDVGSVVQDSESGRWFRYKVAVVDLDLKPLSKVEQHFALDQKILECALRTGKLAT